MWKKMLIAIFALAGAFSVVYATNQNILAAAGTEAASGVDFTLGNETFKIIDVNENSAPQGRSTITAVLKRFSHTDVYAGSGATKSYAPIGASDDFLQGYANEFKDLWYQNLSVNEKKIITKTPYVLEYQNDLGGEAGTNSLLSNASLGISGDWWIYYGGYRNDALYVNASGKYDISQNARVKKNVIPAIQIVDYMNAEYTPSAQSYELGVNTNANDVLGTIVLYNHIGDVNISLGPTPDIAGDHASDYESFSVPSSIDDDTANVTIKNDLHAGEYYFRITMTDTKALFQGEEIIDVHITIPKLAASIAFTDTSTLYMKIGDSVKTGTVSYEIQGTYTVEDIAYTLSGGSAGVGLSVQPKAGDPATYQLSLGTTDENVSLPTTFVLHASIPETADLLPSETATDRSIIIFKGLEELIWSSSSSEDFNVGDVVSNREVGQLLALNGLPEYTYALTTDQDQGYDSNQAKDNDKFLIASGALGSGVKASVKTRTALGAGEYKMQFKVTDGNGDVKYAAATIRVSANAQAALNFKDNGANITSKTITYGTPVTVRAEGGEPTISSLPTYALSNPEDAEYLIVEDLGNGTARLTPQKVTAEHQTVKVKAIKAGNSVYGSISTELSVTIIPASQTLAFDDPQTTYVAYVDGVSTYQSATLVPEGAITYSTMTDTICNIDVNGLVTAHSVGTCTIKAGNARVNYEPAEATKNIVFYEGINAQLNQTNIPQAGNNANSGTLIGEIEVDGGMEGTTYTYAISEGESTANVDHALFQVDDAYGTLSLNGVIAASDLMGKAYSQEKQAYELHVMINVIDEVAGTTTPISATVYIKGAAMPAIAFAGDDGRATSRITRVYENNGAFTVGLVNNSGSGRPVYSFKSGPEDVINPQITGNRIQILHANEASVSTPVIIEASIPASNGYEAATVECEVKITKAQQSEFSFKTTPLRMFPGGQLTPEFQGMKTSGEITMSSDDSALAGIEGDTIIAGDSEGETIIRAVITGDRDYQDGSCEVPLIITREQAYPFVISAEGKTYGNEPFTVRIQSSHSEGAQITREWTSSDPEIASIDDNGEITIHKAGTVRISCIQHSSMDMDVESGTNLQIARKPVTVRIQNVTKKVGEGIPQFHADIDTAQLVGDDTISQPDFGCLDEQNQSVTETTGPGAYDITGIYETGAYPNYEITVEQGTLTITQDSSADAWYEIRGKDSGEVKERNTWSREDVYVALKQAESAPYDQISLDGIHWSQRVLVDEEGTFDTQISFQQSGTGALATTQATVINIDRTNPVIQQLSGEAVERNVITELLNRLTFGHFFKPQDEITILAHDVQKAGVNKISGIKEITYQMYELHPDTGLPVNLNQPYKEDTIATDSEAITFRVEAIGLYRICATATDHAGNTSPEKCADINVKQIDVDLDNDDIPDLNDSNEDGCPDLNIVVGSDEEGKPVKLNVAEEHKKYPYMNIDSDGDGKADLNIDSDHDGKPDLNLVQMNEDLWKEPAICVTVEQLSMYTQPIEYCTGTDAAPQINVMTGTELIPSLNIDTDGDMKADVNIPKDGYMINIAKHTAWNPDRDFSFEGFDYDTEVIVPVLNIDSNHDGYADINVDVNGDGKADINIDTDGDYRKPETNIDITGNGKPDLNLDPEGTGTAQSNLYELTEWRPTKIIQGEKLPYGIMELNSQDHLEDQGVVVKPSDDDYKFLPNFALKVNDVTDSYSQSEKEELLNQTGNENLKVDSIYDVKLLENDSVIQPDGSVEIQIPAVDGIKNPKLMMKAADGTWKEIAYTVSEGKFIFSTEYIGEVAILSEVEQSPEPEPTPQPPKAEQEEHPTVQGTYTPNNNGIGGANTGDQTNIVFFILLLCCSFLSIILAGKKQKQ